ncbi:MAG: NAD(P)/FAD-dependent oxidoreductase [Pseudonocardiaceae bacterium]
MSAASQALRAAGPDALEVVAFERGHHVSYSACGIPYLVAGDVDTADALIARSAGEHRGNGIDLRLRTEVTEMDLCARTVTAAPLDGGASYQLGFDELVLATGAAPVRPDLPGVNAPGVFGVQTLDDGTAVLAALSGRPRRAVVVGGGYIGIETGCGPAATASRCCIASRSDGCTCRWAPTPTNTAGSSAPTSAAATRPSPAWSAPPSPRSATSRSLGPGCWRPRRGGRGSSR